MNILGYFFEQFQRFSRDLQPHQNLVDNHKSQVGIRQQNTITSHAHINIKKKIQNIYVIKVLILPFMSGDLTMGLWIPSMISTASYTTILVIGTSLTTCLLTFVNKDKNK